MKFKFYNPTKIICGENCIANNADVLTAFGKTALIVTGGHSAKANGSLEDVVAALEKNSQSYTLYDKVLPNPTVESAYDGAKIAKETKADFVIAIGGGSPMDAAKAIAYLAVTDIDEDSIFSTPVKSALPIICVPTTAGTGSEVTLYSILTSHKRQTKLGLAADALFPKVAFLDAKYMLQLGKQTTVNTAIDALSHAVEGLISNRANEYTEILAVESIAIISGLFDKLKKFELNFDEREQLLYASALAGVVIANTGTTGLHGLGYNLTYFKNIDHGRSNGLLMKAYLEFVNKYNPEIIGKIVNASGLNSFDEFVGNVQTLLGEKEPVTPEEVDKFVSIAKNAPALNNNIVRPSDEEIRDVYFKTFDLN